MLDTNICIYAIRKKSQLVLQRFKDNMERGLCISSITLAELALGVEKSAYPARNMMALFQFLSIISVLPFDSLAASEYGRVCGYLQKQGTPIGIMDTLIASHALSQGMTLITNNTREFIRVPALKIEDWV